MRRTLLTAGISLMALWAATGAVQAGQVPADAATTPAAVATQPKARADAVPPLDPEAMALLNQVLDRVRRSYVEAVPDEALIEAAVNGILTSLDPHSTFLNTQDYADMKVQTSGEFGGLGIEIQMHEGLVRIVSPIDDTPAARAGLQAGDLITEIGGAQVRGMSVKEAVSLMRGPVGTTVDLKVRRGEAEAFPVTLERATVRSQAVKHEIEGDVGYVRITSFTQQTQAGLEKAVRRIEQELGDRLMGYVVDLRNNPGGLLNQAVSVADSFLDAGTIVSTRGRGGVETQRFEAKPGDLFRGLPVVLLVNSGSASASEIVAGALQDNRRAVVLGTQSFGKGSVQTIMPLESGGRAIKMTTARYYTPSGRSIQAVGITPDILVEPATLTPAAQASQRKEADLPHALSNDAPATRPDGGTAAPADAGGDAKPFDYQRSRAVDLLKGLATFRPAPAVQQVVDKRQAAVN